MEIVILPGKLFVERPTGRGVRRRMRADEATVPGRDPLFEDHSLGAAEYLAGRIQEKHDLVLSKAFRGDVLGVFGELDIEIFLLSNLLQHQLAGRDRIVPISEDDLRG